MSEIEVKRLREEGFEVVQKLSERDVENQKQAQQNKIQNSSYDISYNELYDKNIRIFKKTRSERFSKDHSEIYVWKRRTPE